MVIQEEVLTWSEFNILFRKKYISERYYDDRENEFYKLKMESITDEEYTRRFFQLLRYRPYLKVEKAEIQRFIGRLSIAFRDRIEFDEPKLLEEAIRKIKHCYEQSKCRSETKKYWKGNEKNKGKWDKKQIRPQDTGNQDN